MNTTLNQRIIEFCIKNEIRYEVEEDNNYICGKDIGTILDLKFFRKHIKNYKKKYFINNKKKNMGYINFVDFIKLLIGSRTIKSNEILEELKIKNEDSIKVIPVEIVTIKFIKECFDSENMIQQYIIDNYRIDLYFPDYKLAIECDEEATHATNNLRHDIIRQQYIEDKLKCKFIRYRPQREDFNITKVINEIYKHILLYK